VKVTAEARAAARAARYGEPTDTYTWDIVVDKVIEAIEAGEPRLVTCPACSASYAPLPGTDVLPEHDRAGSTGPSRCPGSGWAIKIVGGQQ
jgi:hypothetical protein